MKQCFSESRQLGFFIFFVNETSIKHFINEKRSIYHKPMKREPSQKYNSRKYIVSYCPRFFFGLKMHAKEIKDTTKIWKLQSTLIVKHHNEVISYSSIIINNKNSIIQQKNHIKMFFTITVKDCHEVAAVLQS